MSIKRVADTVADAVRIAVENGTGDFWNNKLEDGELKRAHTRNNVLSPAEWSRRSDDLTMRARVRCGRLSA